jgi:hypothetical protein
VHRRSMGSLGEKIILRICLSPLVHRVPFDASLLGRLQKTSRLLKGHVACRETATNERACQCGGYLLSVLFNLPIRLAGHRHGHMNHKRLPSFVLWRCARSSVTSVTHAPQK